MFILENSKKKLTAVFHNLAQELSEEIPFEITIQDKSEDLNFEILSANDDENDIIINELQNFVNNTDSFFYQCGECDKDNSLFFVKEFDKFICANCLNTVSFFECGNCGEILPENKNYFGLKNAGYNENRNSLEYKTICNDCLKEENPNLVDVSK